MTERFAHHTGTAVVAIDIDIQTGKVAKVTTLRSTGYPALDAAAVRAIRQWKWKPGTWRRVTLPVDFTLTAWSAWPPKIPRDAIMLPPAQPARPVRR
jgi:TonB family protein